MQAAGQSKKIKLQHEPKLSTEKDRIDGLFYFYGRELVLVHVDQEPDQLKRFDEKFFFLEQRLIESGFSLIRLMIGGALRNVIFSINYTDPFQIYEFLIKENYCAELFKAQTY